MADLRDALARAAGGPPAELDMDRVLARGAQRRRNTRLGQVAAAVLPMAGLALAASLLSGNGDSLGPDRAPVASSGAPAAALVDDTGLTALPVGPDERIDYAYVRPVSTEGLLTYDKLEYDEAACRAVQSSGATVAEADEACFSNTNALERTVSIDDSSLVVVAGPDGRPQQISLAALEVLLSSTRPERPLTSTAWRVVLRERAGERPLVVRMTELVVAGR